MRRLLLVLLLLTALAACGDDGGPDDGGQGRTPGLIVGQRVTDGSLEDLLVVVDPARPGQEEIELADVARGTPAGPGRALYESGTEIVLVDATGQEVSELGVLAGEVDLAYSSNSVRGGGERFIVLLSPTGEGAQLVDVEEASAVDLIPFLDGATTVLGAEVAEDESVVLLNTGDGVHLVPTEDPEAARQVGDGAGQLLDGGDRVLVTGPNGVAVVDADGEVDEVITEETGGGALALGERILLGRGDEAVLLEPGSDEVLASAPFSPTGSAPVAVGGTVLLPSGPEPSWTLLDGTTAEVTALDDLEGLVPAFSGQPSRWIPFGEGAGGGTTLAAVDTADGSLAPPLDLPAGEQIVGFALLAPAESPWALISVDSADGTRAVLVDLDTGATQDLGANVQGVAFSPDGEQVAWSAGDAAELRVAPVDDVADAEVVADGVALPVWLPAED